MSSYAAGHHALPQARHTGLYTQGQPGSALQQVGVAILAVILAILLIVGQIALATTHDIQQRLHHSVQNLASANQTVDQVIERSRPNATILTKLQAQQRVLAHTSTTLAQLNRSMAQITGVTTSLGTTVNSMRTTSAQLSSGVSGMSRDTTSIAKLIGPLPQTAGAIGASMQRIDGDSSAINTELGAINGKMKGYGLPQARESKR